MATWTVAVPHVYSVGSTRHYFACRLRTLLTLSALHYPADRYPLDLYRRHVDLLNCLTNPHEEQATYDLRLLSHPDPQVYLRGRIDVALVCRTDGIDAQGAARQAQQLLQRLAASFEEYEFEPAKAEEIRSLLAPFPVRHLVALTRRVSREALDTLRSGEEPPRRTGFAAGPDLPVSATSAEETVLHVFPFLPSHSPHNTLFKLLLLHESPVAVSCRLRPTRLTPEEEAVFEQQIATCERYAQASIGLIGHDLRHLRPTLQAQARAYQHYQSRMLLGLRDNAALMALEIASPDPIPHTIVDAFGSLLTEPGGGLNPSGEASFVRYLAGGYEVLGSEGPEAVAAFQDLDIHLPQTSRIPHLFDSVEATAAFRFPSATDEGLLGIDMRSWTVRPAPRNLPDEGLLVGVTVEGGAGRPVRISPQDRMRHLYVVGQTGTGKTTMLKTMILDDMARGEGLCVIDPHGDLLKDLVRRIPASRRTDVVMLDPTDAANPVSLNLLEYQHPTQRYFIVQEMVSIIAKLVEDEFGLRALGEMTGPVFFQHMRMNLLLVMSNPGDPGTLLDFYNIYQEKDYWQRWLPLREADEQLERWVTHVLPHVDYLSQGRDSPSMGGYVGSKFEGFIFDPMLRSIFAKKRSTIRLRDIMDAGKILLVNLAKGELTETNSRFLGMVLLAKLQAEAMGRVNVPESQRRVFHVYVDEFQSIATQSFITLISESRKFGLSLGLANQFISQIRDPRIVQSIFGNVGTLVAFRLGQQDAELVEREMYPAFTRGDLINLPNWTAYVATLINGQNTPPFSVSTLVSSEA